MKFEEMFTPFDHTKNYPYVPPVAGQKMVKKPIHIAQVVDASKYAAFCARHKPNCCVNQRQAKMVKNKAWRKFKPSERIKTHDQSSDSFKVWSGFYGLWSSMKDQKRRTVKEC